MAKLNDFLKMIDAGAWRTPPAAWRLTYREALGDGLVTVGWGGVLKLTEAGRAALASIPEQRGSGGQQS